MSDVKPEPTSSAQDPDARSSQLGSFIRSLLPLVETEDPNLLVNAILRAATQLFETEGCSLGVVDEERQEIVFSKMAGEAQIAEFRVSMDQGIAGWVASRNEGVISNDVSQDSRFYSGIDRKSSGSSR